MVSRAMEVALELEKNGVNVEVINARFLKPFVDKNILDSMKSTKNVITIEDGLLRGGLATTINEMIVKNNLVGVKILNFGYEDKYVKHGSVDEIEKINGLDVDSIVNKWAENK